MNVKRKILKRMHPIGNVRYEIRKTIKGRRSIKLAQKYGKPIDGSQFEHVHCYLTFRCNLGCYFCINKLLVDKLPKHTEAYGDQWIDYLNRIYNIGTLYFQGGEPFLHTDFVHILNNLDGFNILIFSNLPKQKIEYFEQIKPRNNNILIECSFHPLDDEPINMFIERIKRFPKGVNVTPHIVNVPEVASYQYLDYFQRHGIYAHVDPCTMIQKVEKFKTVRCRTNELIISPDMRRFRCVTHLLEDIYGSDNLESLDNEFLICERFPKCGTCLYREIEWIE